MSWPRSAKSVVLIVEDEPMVRSFAVEMVQDAGFEVIAAANADDAIRILETISTHEEGPPNIGVSDHRRDRYFRHVRAAHFEPVPMNAVVVSGLVKRRAELAGGGLKGFSETASGWRP